MGYVLKHPLKYGKADFYAYYCNEIEEGSVYDVGYKLHWQILVAGNRKLFSKAFEGKVVRLLPFIGEFELMKYKVDYTKIKRRPIDWTLYNKTKDPKDIGFILNTHTNGYRYFLCWTRSAYGIPKHTRDYGIIYSPYIKKMIYESAMNNMDCFIYNQKERNEKAAESRAKGRKKHAEKEAKEKDNGIDKCGICEGQE